MSAAHYHSLHHKNSSSSPRHHQEDTNIKEDDSLRNHISNKLPHVIEHTQWDNNDSNQIKKQDAAEEKKSVYEEAEKKLNYFFKLNQKVDWQKADSSYFHHRGDKLEVACNVVVLNLADIDTATMSYRMKLEIWVAWPLTKEEVISYYENPDDWKPYIKPDPTPWTITIEDSHKMQFLSGRTIQVFLWRGKFVACECTLVTAIYLESMELVNFPFDSQHFHALIGLRCDCDIPYKVVDGKVKYACLDSMSVGGFNNFDGRAMASMVLNPKGCTFNVRTHLLALKDFALKNIECEIENTPKDIPFLHCTLRMARNFESYVFRFIIPIAVLLFNTTLVFRFYPQSLADRLTYVVTNMLTIVAFFFIISSSLPQIPYLTLIDKYMNAALVYIFSLAILCVCFTAYEIEGTDTENNIFYAFMIFLAVSHVFFGYYCTMQRRLEYQKLFINRHEIAILEEHRMQSSWFGGEVTSKDEFLVHTEINDVDRDNKDSDGNERQTYTGVLRKHIHPPEAAGWLFEGEGSIVVKQDERKVLEKEHLDLIKHSMKNGAKKLKDVGRLASNAANDVMRNTANSVNKIYPLHTAEVVQS